MIQNRIKPIITGQPSLEHLDCSQIEVSIGETVLKNVRQYQCLNTLINEVKKEYSFWPAIKEYITDNPQCSHQDKEHPVDIIHGIFQS